MADPPYAPPPDPLEVRRDALLRHLVALRTRATAEGDHDALAEIPDLISLAVTAHDHLELGYVESTTAYLEYLMDTTI